MKTKLLTCLVFGLALLASLSMVSATISFSNVPTLSQSGTSGAITVSTDANELITFSGLNQISDGKGHVITFTLPAPVTINTTSTSITIPYTIGSGFVFDFGKEYSTTLTATGATSPVVNQKLSFSSTDYCKAGNVGDLSIDIDDIKVSGFGDDEEWYALDSVEVTVNVENIGDDDIDDIVVYWCLYSDSEGKCVINDDEKKFDLKDGKDKDVTFIIKLDPEDLESGSEDYTLYVKAYSKDLGETSQCVSESQSIQVIRMDDFVVIDKESIEIPETVSCGEEIIVTGDVWNIGDDDQEDVYIEIVIRELNIKQKIEIGDIDSFENEDFSATIKIPSNAKAQTYTVEFVVYDEDDDVYESDDGADARFTKSITVEGNCQTSVPSKSVSITASLSSDVKAGNDLVVEAIVTNRGDASETYTISARGMDDWGSLGSVDPSVFTLEKGASKEVKITLKTNKDVSGEKTFDIVATTLSGETKQSVAVNFPASSNNGGFKFPSITGGVINSGNWYLWGIGALNILLILIIIVVAIRVAKS